MEEIAASAWEYGVFSHEEIATLRSVVRESLEACGPDSSQQVVEVLARHILDAYRCGIRDRAALLQIARARSSQFTAERPRLAATKCFVANDVAGESRSGRRDQAGASVCSCETI